MGNISRTNYIIVGIAYVLFALIFSLLNESMVDKSVVFILSWVGLIQFVLQMVQYRKKYGTFFDLYTIFLLFFTLFNFGQCLGWAFGIHTEDEIGARNLYGFMSATNYDIARAQLMFLICSFIMHSIVMSKNAYESHNYSIDLKSDVRLFKIAKMFSIIVFPVSLGYTIFLLQASKIYGYQALYYDDIMTNVSPIVIFINKMFVPCIIALLVGSAYRKKVVMVVYVIFLIYIVIDLSSGDRGAWIYLLIMIVWMHNKFYHPLSKKMLLIGICAAYLFFSVTDSITKVRNEGISIENISQQMNSDGDNFVVSTVFNMGHTMGVNVVTMAKDARYPYGISYLLAILGGMSTGVLDMLGISYSTPTKWLSQEYMGITWGAGLSNIAESIINFGSLFAPLIFILIGMLIRKTLLYYSWNSALRWFVCLALACFLLGTNRSTAHEFMKSIIYGILPILITYKFSLKKN